MSPKFSSKFRLGGCLPVLLQLPIFWSGEGSKVVWDDFLEIEELDFQVMEESIRKPWFTWMKTSNHIIRVREFRWKQPARGAGNSFHQSVGESCDFLPDSISSYVDSFLDTFRNGGWTDSFFIAKLQESLLLFQSCDLERETTLW